MEFKQSPKSIVNTVEILLYFTFPRRDLHVILTINRLLSGVALRA